MLFRLASPIIFRTAESRTVTVEGERASMPARQATERYPRSDQEIAIAVNDNLGL
jgi:hypothetical protein